MYINNGNVLILSINGIQLQEHLSFEWRGLVFVKMTIFVSIHNQ